MAPKAKQVAFRDLDDDAKIQRLYARAAEQLLAKNKRMLLHAIEKHPDHINDLCEALTMKGVKLAEPPKKGKGPALLSIEDAVLEGHSDTTVSTHAVHPGAADPGDAGLAPLIPEPATLDKNTKNWMPNKIKTVADAGNKELMEFIGGVFTVNLSVPNLKAVYGRKYAGNVREALLRHWEYCFGLSRDFEFTGNLRHIPTLMVRLKSESKRLGNRGALITVTPKYDEEQDGVFKKVAVKTGDVSIYHKAFGVPLGIPIGERLKFINGDIIPIESLEIADNYFEGAARVVSKYCSGHIKIDMLGKFEPEGPNRSLAICDNSVASSRDTTSQRTLRQWGSTLTPDGKKSSPRPLSPDGIAEAISPGVASIWKPPREKDWTPPSPEDKKRSRLLYKAPPKANTVVDDVAT
jgi:hypothetical protein